MIEKYTNGAWAELAGYKKYSETTFDLSSFPASFQSEGLDMSDYRIYGANDGVGERTENLFDISTATMATYWIDDDSNTFTYSETSRCYFIPASANVTYTVTDFTDILPPDRFVFRVAFTNAIPTSHAANVGTTYLRQRVNSTGGDKHFATLTNQSYNYLAIQVRTTEPNDVMLTEGSTVPAQYIPFGYQINAEVGDGVTATDIPIYIGDTPLAQGEYVDYGEQKVYKYVGGELTPTEPPVALPALPTIDGETIADFDNTPKPSRMMGEAIGWKTMTPKIYENGAWTDLT